MDVMVAAGCVRRYGCIAGKKKLFKPLLKILLAWSKDGHRVPDRDIFRAWKFLLKNPHLVSIDDVKSPGNIERMT